MTTETHTDAVQKQDRRKRVQTLKKIIVSTLVAAIVLPIVLCIVLFIRVVHLESRLLELTALLEEQNEQIAEWNEMQHAREEDEQEQVKEEPVLSESAEKEIRNVYLTFDDGPSEYTDEILDILKEYDVKATFFVTGREGAQYTEIYRRIVAEGHTLGMHSYSHKYDEIYASRENFEADFFLLQQYLYNVTGVECKIYRFPGGSGNTVSRTQMSEFIAFLEEQGVTYYDWNVSSQDASGNGLSVKQIVDNCTGNMDYYNNAFILLHDSKDKWSTVEALPFIIEDVLAMENTQLVPITEETVPVQQKTN